MTSSTPAYDPAQQALDLGLPIPREQETEVSHALVRKICQAAAGDNGIPFSNFMNLALYDPEFGYYSAGKHKFGAEGDFVTAPELGPVFAYCLADQCEQVLRTVADGMILEAGAGRGQLATDLLLELEQRDSLPEHYMILELGHGLRTIQQETLAARAPHLLNRVQWLESFPDNFTGIILGNELLDAMPVELFEVHDTGTVRLTVYCENGLPVFGESREIPARMRDRLQQLSLPTGYRFEINLHAEAWIRSAADALAEGVILLFDYGFPRDEYYHPQRRGGTLMCHYRHHAHGDPLSLIGLQDITAHVDFTAMAEAAADSQMDVLGYTSQAAFLMANGLDKLVNASDPGRAENHMALTAQIKRLTQPSEMGELFKVIAFGKQYNEPLNGFLLQDRRHRL